MSNPPSFNFGPSLVGDVYRVIHAQRPDLAELFLSRYNPSMFNRPGRAPLDNMNSFWQDQLSNLEHTYNIRTVEIREYLCPSNAPTVWLEHFTTYVLPVIIANNLPYVR